MPGKIMAKITTKGGLTLPKKVRDAVGLKPGDVVDVRPTSSGSSDGGLHRETRGAQEL
jgi:AbrB family looped-hinge helix DNA binding protein